MKLLKRTSVDSTVHHDNTIETMNLPYSKTNNVAFWVLGFVGCVALVGLAIAAALVIRRKKGSASYRYYKKRFNFKRFSFPKESRPVISFKTAAGPGGLKKTPSPIHSPEEPIRDFHSRLGSYSSYQSCNSSSRKSSAAYGSLTGEKWQSRKSSAATAGDSRKSSGFELRKFSAGSLGRKITEAVEHRRKLSDTPMVGGEPLDVGEPSTSEVEVIEAAAAAAAMLDTATAADSARKSQLKIGLVYSLEKTSLCVTIMGATHLTPTPKGMNKHKSSCPPVIEGAGANVGLDPYIKLQLLPEKQHKVKTKVVKNTLNPCYDESFTFYGLNYNQLQITTLHFAIITCDRFSRDEVIGEVMCALNSVDLSESNKQVTLNLDVLTPSLKFQNATSRGDVLVSMCYHPSTNKITVVVLKAKSLPKFDITGLSDPYVKVYLIHNGQKLAKKKTHVKKRTLSPVWNESFVFDLPAPASASASASAMSDGNHVLDNLNFEFLVMDWDRITRNEVMARVDIGAKAKCSSGRCHWEEVRKNPRKQIAQWHRLNP